MTKASAFSVFVAVFLAWSCELVTQVELPEIPEMLVVNSIFNADSTWKLSLTRSKDILADYPIVGVPGALVVIKDDLGMELVLNDDGQGLYSFPAKPQPNRTYELNVTSYPFEKLAAITTAPTNVDLLEVVVDSANAVPGGADRFPAVPVTLRFKDPPNETNYYRLQVWITQEMTRPRPGGGRDTFLVTRPLHLSEAPNSDFGGTTGEISDLGFDGEEHTFQLYLGASFFIPSGLPGITSMRFYLQSYSEDYQRYFKSGAIQDESKSNPFAQPAQVFSNIDKGLGIFAGYSMSKKEFKY